MKAKIIDGNKLSKEILDSIKSNMEKNKITPSLKIIVANEDKSSKIYVGRKVKIGSEIGINVEIIKYSKEDATEENLIKKIQSLNEDNKANGIIVQLPLFGHLDKLKICNAINPRKDVDGLTAENCGRLNLGFPESEIHHTPCTPTGCIYALQKYNIHLEGKRCLIINRSNIVGKPLSAMLTRNDATVIMANSKTKNLQEEIKNADIIFTATGRVKSITGDMIKTDAVLIDIGISKFYNGEKFITVGDCDFESCSKVASYITPVPGGIGPLTVAFLMKNVCKGLLF